MINHHGDAKIYEVMLVEPEKINTNREELAMLQKTIEELSERLKNLSK
jgi:ubiquinone biosynthesis protein UbiJ